MNSYGEASERKELGARRGMCNFVEGGDGDLEVKSEGKLMEAEWRKRERWLPLSSAEAIEWRNPGELTGGWWDFLPECEVTFLEKNCC